MKTLDATKYKWERLDSARIKAFGISCAIGKLYVVADVEFERETLRKLQYGDVNGNSPIGSISENAAIELNDGSIIFCVVEGKDWGDTFNSGDKIEMEYYRLTPL